MHKFFLLMLAAQLVFCHKQEMDGNLYKVYGVDFPKFLDANPVVLFILHDNSKHSQKVLEVLRQVDTKLLQENIPLKIARMTVRESPSYAKMWHAHHLPHLRLYIGDGVYDDLRVYPSLNNIYNWVTTILDNPDRITLIDSDAKVDKFNKEPFAFYLRFPADQTQYVDLLKKFQKLDSSLKVYYTHKAAYDPFESYNPKELVVGLRRNFDDGNKFLASEKKLNQLSIHNFFELFRHPEVHRLTKEYAHHMDSNKTRSIVLFDNGEKNDLITQFRKVAAGMKQILRFVHADIKDSQSQELAKVALIETSTLPQIRILDTVDDRQRLFVVNATTADEIIQEIEKYNSGQLMNLLEELTSDL
jgi:hypothetical protein